MATVVPAILETNIDNLTNRLHEAQSLIGANRFQIDFCDGHFVSNKTVPITEIPVLSPGFLWEAHLMVQFPQDFTDYKIVGFSTVIIHSEAFPSPHALKGALLHLRDLGLKAGLAIKPDTAIASIREVVNDFDQLTLLSVEPGKQGQNLLTGVEEKIRQAKSEFPHVTIEVDGGINAENIASLVSAGADLLAVGAFIFHSPNPVLAFEQLGNNLQTV